MTTSSPAYLEVKTEFLGGESQPRLIANDGRSFNVGERPLRDRRSPDVEVVINDSNVSRQHAEVWRTSEGVAIRDLQSTNGTFVNGHRVTAVSLSPVTTSRSARSIFGLSSLESLAATSNYAAICSAAPSDWSWWSRSCSFCGITRVACGAGPTNRLREAFTTSTQHDVALEFVEPTDRSGERVDVDAAVTIDAVLTVTSVCSDTFLSSRHARLTNDEGDLSIEDLGSTNGTYVNQELVDGRVHLETW